MSQLLLDCFWFPKWALSYCEPSYSLSKLFSQFKNKTVQMSKNQLAGLKGLIVLTCWSIHQLLLSSAAAEFVAVATVC